MTERYEDVTMRLPTVGVSFSYALILEWLEPGERRTGSKRCPISSSVTARSRPTWCCASNGRSIRYASACIRQ